MKSENWLMKLINLNKNLRAQHNAIFSSGQQKLCIGNPDSSGPQFVGGKNFKRISLLHILQLRYF